MSYEHAPYTFCWLKEVHITEFQVVALLVNMKTTKMDIDVKIILILILPITRPAFAQKLEYGNMQKEVQHSDECDLILVSHSLIENGKILNGISERLLRN